MEPPVVNKEEEYAQYVGGRNPYHDHNLVPGLVTPGVQCCCIAVSLYVPECHQNSVFSPNEEVIQEVFQSCGAVIDVDDVTDQDKGEDYVVNELRQRTADTIDGATEVCFH